MTQLRQRPLFLIAFFAVSGILHAEEIASVSEQKAAPISAPDRKAMQIAYTSSLIQRNLKALTDEAAKISDKQLHDDSIEILERPRFTVVSFRKPEEARIIQDLQDNHLLDPGVARIFPDHPPMPFIAAPASFWRQHHTYPGGLVNHTLSNLLNAVSLANNYSDAYNTAPLNFDWLRAAAIWHDSAKTMTIQWNDDGTASPSEGPPIAGTGAHHIWAIAEALYRDYPADFLITLASAHNPAHPTKGLEDLVRYLQAAAIIAGRPIEAAGLKREGSKIVLAGPVPIESFLHHLSDHDYVMTEATLPLITQTIRDALVKDPTLLGHDPIDWKIDLIFSRYGEKLYQTFLKSGTEGVQKRITQLDIAIHH